MPQLLPDPWFYIFAFSWLILITVTPKKIISHTDPHDPNPTMHKFKHKTWTWPW